jgi:hypothetical protein
VLGQRLIDCWACRILDALSNRNYEGIPLKYGCKNESFEPHIAATEMADDEIARLRQALAEAERRASEQQRLREETTLEEAKSASCKRWWGTAAPRIEEANGRTL